MKKIISLLISGALVLSLTACSSGVSREEYDKVVAERDALSKKISQLEADSNISGNNENTSKSAKVWVPENTPSISGQTFNQNEILSNLEIKEYTLKDSLNYSVLLEIKNNSNLETELNANMQFYNGDKLIGSDKAYPRDISPKSETVLVFRNDDEFTKYNYDITPLEVKNYKCVTQNISYEESLTENKAIITATNNGNESIKYAEGIVLFFKSSDLVDFGYLSFEDEDMELKPSQSKIDEVRTNESFDSIKVFFFGQGRN